MEEQSDRGCRRAAPAARFAWVWIVLAIVLIAPLVIGATGIAFIKVLCARENEQRRHWLFDKPALHVKQIEFDGQQRYFTLTQQSVLDAFEHELHGLAEGGAGGITYSVTLTLENDRKIHFQMYFDTAPPTITVIVNEYLVDDPDYFHVALPSSAEWTEILDRI